MRCHRETLQDKRHKFKKFVFSTAFRVGLVVTISLFVVLDVIQTSTVSTKGYEISQLQQEITSLEHEAQRLEYEIAKHRSMKSIQARVSNLDLVHAGDAAYITLSGNAVAQR